jgi:hypothetical protein
MMRYYSAPRRETVWTRAEDWALVGALLLSLPAAWVADRAVIEPREALTTSGLLLGQREDQLRGWVTTELNMRMEPPGKAFARWSLVVTDEYRGWPLTTSVARQPATLNLDVVEEPSPRKHVLLPMDSPMRQTIADALRSEQMLETLAAWELPQAQVRRHWWSWLAAWAGWWIGLTLASWCAIRVIRLVTLQVQRSRKIKEFDRRAEGKCAACGYDLTGLDFHDRCPECGTLMW